MFDFIMNPLYYAISFILKGWHTLWSEVGLEADGGASWALSIIGLTLVIRVALIPLFVKQIKSSRNMQLIQPRVRELQKKYKHDRERLAQEQMKLYKDTNTNPFSACLPLLLQMPIFLALFRVLDGAARDIPRGHWLRIHPELLDSLNSSTIVGARISDTFTKVGFADGITSVHLLTLGLIIAMTVTLFITQLQLMRKNMPAEALEGAATERM